MTKTSYSLVFNRRKRLNSKGQGAIEIYCYQDKMKIYFSTGIKVLPTEWDKKKNQVGKENPNAIKLNILLSRMISKIEDHELSIMNEREFSLVNDLKGFSLKGQNSRNNIIAWLEDQIEADNTVASGTTGYRKTMLDKLKAAVGDDLKASQVNHEAISRFDNYMAKENLSGSSRSKLHNQLRKFLTIAKHQEVIKKNPYNTFKVKRPVYDMKKCLWFADLDKIWELEYPEDSGVELARLKFLFSVYTGLRISDNTRLTWDEIRHGKLFVKMQKTVRPVVVPINLLGERAGIILDKAKRVYNDPDRVFRYIPDQATNKYLKRIGIDAGLPLPLTFHVARHTFCTMVAHQTGSVFKVMEYAGIYKVDTAMIYVNLNRLYSQ